MSVIPCARSEKFQSRIIEFAETLKTQAHRLAPPGIDETDFYQLGLFRAAVERVHGQFSATMREKREFVQHVLNHMKDQGFVASLGAVALRGRVRASARRR